MKKISREQVKKIAELAHLNLQDEEIDTLSEDMSKILEYFSLLEEVDVSKIDETIYVQDIQNVLRKDEKKEFTAKEEILANFPQKEGNFLIVPQSKS